MRRPRRRKSTSSPGWSATPISSRSPSGGYPPRRSSAPRVWSQRDGSPMPMATSRAPPRRTMTPSSSKIRSCTWSRRTGITRSGSRSPRCGCGRASSTRPSRSSANRSRACATTPGRSPVSTRRIVARATLRQRKRRGRHSPRHGSESGGAADRSTLIGESFAATLDARSGRTSATGSGRAWQRNVAPSAN